MKTKDRRASIVLMVYLALCIVYAICLLVPERILILSPDSIGYLVPALEAIEKGVFTHHDGRGFPYSLFLMGVFSINQSPEAIVVAQMTVAFLTFVLIAFTTWLILDFCVRRQLIGFARLLSFSSFWLLVYAVHPLSVLFSRSVLAENLFIFLLALTILCVVKFWLLDNESNNFRYVYLGGAIFFGVLLSITKPHWLLAAGVFPIVLVFVVKESSRWKTVFFLLLLAPVIGLSLYLPERALQHKYDPYVSKVFGARSIFCNSADVIYRSLGEAARTGFDTAIWHSLEPVVNRSGSRRPWTTLGFNGDDCTWSTTGELAREHFEGNPSAEASYYLRTYARALISDPMYIPRRLASQFRMLAQGFFGSSTSVVRTGVSQLHRPESNYSILQMWEMNHKSSVEGTIVTVFSKVEKLLFAIYLAVSLIFLAIFLLSVRAIVLQKTVASVCSDLRRIYLCLLLLALGGYLLVAIVHTFDISRYAAMYAPFIVILGSIASAIVFSPGYRVQGTKNKF